MPCNDLFHAIHGVRPRWFVQNLESALRVLPVAVVSDARETGKTTLFKFFRPARSFLTPDDVGLLDQAERRPDSTPSRWPGSLPTSLQQQSLPSLPIRRESA